jgi:sugar (pentulose or hexulose) kinase
VLPDPSRVAAVGLAVERLPAELDAGTIVGGLRTEAADALGLATGLPVVAGPNDAFASFVGAGLLDAGDAVDTGGSSGGLAVYWDRPVDVPGAWVGHAPLPDRWVVGGAMTATGKALDWLAGSIVGGSATPDALIAEAAGVAPGADGLVFLPYLAGERSPIWDPGARGAFVGLTLGHGRAHLARAVLEAAALALRHVAAPILAAGLRIDQLVVTGGTARGDTWNRIKADVLGVPVTVPQVPETAVLGAAILGATAVEWHADVRAAIGAMVRIDHRLEPDPARAARYDALYEAYVELWPAIAPTVRRLRGLPSG